MTLFYLGRNNCLSVTSIVFDSNYERVCGYWLSGRFFGKYLSLYFPLFWRKAANG